MNLQEMVQKYEKITGETVSFDNFFFDGDYHNKDNLHFKLFPEGFLFWAIIERNGKRYFFMGQTYGKMAGMVDYIKKVMAMNGLVDIVTATTRNPKAHVRKWKMEYLPQYNYVFKGRIYHVLIGTVDNLK